MECIAKSSGDTTFVELPWILRIVVMIGNVGGRLQRLDQVPKRIVHI